MITFIIPVYNGEKTIAQCLESVLMQKANKEIIVVDNLSTDETVNIVRKYPVKLFIEPKRGPAAARNKGLNETSKSREFVAFIDSDVVLPDEYWAKRAIFLFEKDNSIVGVGGPVKSLKSNYISKSLTFLLYSKSFLKEKYVKAIPTMNAVYKKDAIDNLKFDESFPSSAAEDVDFNFRLIKSGNKILFSPIIWIYHDHPLSLKQLCKKWFNYGKFYPMPYFNNGIYSLDFFARLFFLPLLLLFFIFSFYFIIFRYILVITFLSLPISYLVVGLKIQKFYYLLPFVFVHTIKQWSQLLGIWVGMIRRLLKI